MKEHPILMSAPMVVATLRDITPKTQTRRIVKPQGLIPADWASWSIEAQRAVIRNRSPYGQPGDRLWVRESWMPDPPCDGTWAYTAWAGCRTGKIADVPERFQHPAFCNYAASWLHGPVRWTPSIHMPRWASRILLEIVSIRVERLQDISEADARAEGIADGGCLNCGEHEPCGCAAPEPDARDSYINLWEQINGAGSWDLNPFVWVVAFKRITP